MGRKSGRLPSADRRRDVALGAFLILRFTFPARRPETEATRQLKRRGNSKAHTVRFFDSNRLSQSVPSSYAQLQISK
jgi:hypothetical protein